MKIDYKILAKKNFDNSFILTILEWSEEFESKVFTRLSDIIVAINIPPRELYSIIYKNNGWIFDEEIYFKSREQLFEFNNNYILPHLMVRKMTGDSIFRDILNNVKEKYPNYFLKII